MRFPSLRCGSFGILVATLPTACEALPKDNFRTFDTVREQRVLKVGAAEHPPWVEFDGDDVRGVEAQLVEAFAQKLGGRVQWSRGPQLELAKRLHHKQLHIVIAGFDDKAPVSEHVAFTQPYVEAKDLEGKRAKHVLTAMPGESRLLYELDRFLLQDATAKQIAATAGTLP